MESEEKNERKSGELLRIRRRFREAALLTFRTAWSWCKLLLLSLITAGLWLHGENSPRRKKNSTNSDPHFTKNFSYKKLSLLRHIIHFTCHLCNAYRIYYTISNVSFSASTFAIIKCLASNESNNSLISHCKLINQIRNYV